MGLSPQVTSETEMKFKLQGVKAVMSTFCSKNVT